jgi:hypothetical protein
MNDSENERWDDMEFWNRMDCWNDLVIFSIGMIIISIILFLSFVLI